MIKTYQNPEWLKEKYWGQKLSQHQIAELIGTTRATVRYWMEKHNIPRRDISEANCGKKRSLEFRRRLSTSRIGKGNPFFAKKHSLQTRQKMSEIKQGERNPNWGKLGKSLRAGEVGERRAIKVILFSMVIFPSIA